MKRFIPIVMLTAVFMFSITGAALAQTDNDIPAVSDIKGLWGAGYRFGWVDEESGPDVDHQHSLNLIYGLTKYTAIQLEGAIGTNDEYESELYSLFGDLQLRAPMDRFAPYILLGFGVQNVDADDVLEDFDDHYLWRAGVGLEFFIGPGMAINFEGLRTIEGGDESFESWQTRAGFKFYFL